MYKEKDWKSWNKNADINKTKNMLLNEFWLRKFTRSSLKNLKDLKSIDDKFPLLKSLIRKKRKEIEIVSKNAAAIPDVILRAKNFLWVIIVFAIYLWALTFFIENILKNILRSLLKYGLRFLDI